MEQKDKELVLHDLCARLPYGVKIQYDIYGIQDLTIDTLNAYIKGIKSIKPYLRPMSSMTEEEKFELKQEHIKDEQLFAEVIVVLNNTEMRGKVIPHFAADWCDKNMFDYRGLIPKGLALEATEEMYNLKVK